LDILRFLAGCSAKKGTGTHKFLDYKLTAKLVCINPLRGFNDFAA
jgi:hypothetical protein